MVKQNEENVTLSGVPQGDTGLFADHYANVEEHIAAIRANRQPFGTFEQKLAYATRPGYKRHWFNDEPGRIERARAAGYVHVKGRSGQNVQRHVGTAKGGGSLQAFLMEIPTEIWLEDKQHEQDKIDSFEAAIKSKKPIGANNKPIDAENGKQEAFYQPAGTKTEIKRSLRRQTGSGL